MARADLSNYGTKVDNRCTPDNVPNFAGFEQTTELVKTIGSPISGEQTNIIVKVQNQAQNEMKVAVEETDRS